MRWILFSLSVTALLLNVGWITLVEPAEEDNTGQNVNNDGTSEIISDIESVTVPLLNVDDQILYDYTLFAEMYSENYTSGEWEKYTFTGEGELLQYVAELQNAEDGFGTIRKTAKYGYETKASFNVKIKTSEGDDVTIPGSLDVKRAEYRNLYDQHLVKAMNDGAISIENLGTLINDDLPSGAAGIDLDYQADLKSYPIPSEDPEETMDEAIFGNEKKLKLTSRGTYEGTPLDYEELREYNWSVTGAYKVQDYDAFKVEVSSSFWNFLHYNRTYYLSSESPYAIKGKTRTNTSFYWDEGEFYIILETTREIKESETALQRGSNPIPWGDTSGHEPYHMIHPAGEFENWEYGPADGTDVDRSSFDGWTQEEAVAYAKENSPELQDFLEEFEAKGKVLISDSVFNISTEDRLGNNETKWWNLTFSYAFDREELEEYYEEYEEWPEWRYRILVARSYLDDRSGTVISKFISRDEGDDRHGRLRGGTDKEELNLNSRIITMTHAEKILKIDPEVKAKAYDNANINEDVLFYYGLIGLTTESTPGLVLIEQMTGISTPTADNAVGFRQDSVWETGSMFSSAVDANTGQMLYVTNIQGSQLAMLFGNV